MIIVKIVPAFEFKSKIELFGLLICMGFSLIGTTQYLSFAPFQRYHLDGKNVQPQI